MRVTEPPTPSAAHFFDNHDDQRERENPPGGSAAELMARTMAGCLTQSLPQSRSCINQQRVVLRAVSPLIWRRLLIRSDATIAEMHATLQTALGWCDDHLNRFVIQGREFGASHFGGIGFCNDPQRVRLVDFGLRNSDRFLYEYDFTDGWQHDVRVERMLPLDPQRRYPESGKKRGRGGRELSGRTMRTCLNLNRLETKGGWSSGSGRGE